MKIKQNSILIICCVYLFSGFNNPNKQKIHIVVAANMKYAMDSIINVYEKDHPQTKIEVTYGSSGKFYEQISHQAPFDLFFSADMNYPKKLIKKNLCVSKNKIYAIGKIVIWGEKINPKKEKMFSLLNKNVKKIAIANPSIAPYGLRAIQCLKTQHLYSKVKSKLVYGEDIAQTAQFVVFGACQLGIIALSEALSPKLMKENGTYYLIPQNSYSPLKQGCVILKRARGKKLAKQFYDFISTDKAIAILKRFGYDVPQ